MRFKVASGDSPEGQILDECMKWAKFIAGAFPACLLAVLLVLSGWGVKAQDLTGQWTGSAMSEGQNHKLVLSINEGDSAFGGVLHWYTPETRTIRHIVISGRFFGKDSTLTIREDSVAAPNRVAGGGPPGGFYILFYRRTAGRRDILEGHWHAGDDYTGRYDLTIRLEKKAPPFLPVPEIKKTHKKDSIDLRRYPILQGRENVVAAHIPVTGVDTAKIELYDNGEIDGDSISVFVNKNIVLSHQELASRALTMYLHLDNAVDINEMSMFAENLGKYPPNTALMVVTDGKNRYEVFMSSSLTENATIQIRRKKAP